jgi:hypothetical protein
VIKSNTAESCRFIRFSARKQRTLCAIVAQQPIQPVGQNVHPLIKITKQHKIVLSTISIVFDSAISGVYFFFFYGQQDQSAVNELQNRDEIVQLLKFGAFLAHILIYKGFGSSFIIVRLFLTGLI